MRVFLSGVASVTHLVYAASYLRHLLATSRAPVTLVDLGLGEFMGRANVSAKDVRDMLPDDDRLGVVTPVGAERWRSRAGEQRVYVGVGAPGIKPYLRLRAAAPTRPLRVVVVDEGIGTYGDWRTRRDAWRREGGRGPWPTIRALAVIGARNRLTDSRWALYERDGAGWRVNDLVAAEFRRGVGRAQTPQPTAVFLSQPWVELGVVRDRAYVGYLHDVAGACRAAGLSFRLRAHPAEDPARYADFDVAAGRDPAELDPGVASATAVLGATSTALLNVAALYGTPAIRVAMPELAGLDLELSPAQRSLLDSFLSPARAVRELPALLRALR